MYSCDPSSHLHSLYDLEVWDTLYLIVGWLVEVFFSHKNTLFENGFIDELPIFLRNEHPLNEKKRATHTHPNILMYLLRGLEKVLPYNALPSPHNV